MGKITDVLHPIPMEYSLGQESKSAIILRDRNLILTHESIYKNTTPSRFYRVKDKSFMFLLEGEVHLKHKDQEVLLRKHQGTFLPIDDVTVMTPLSPNAKLCLIKFFNHQAKEPATFKLERISTGTSHAVSDHSGSKSWILWEGEEGQITIQLYPSGYKETAYYLKNTNQYLLALDTPLAMLIDKKMSKLTTEFGLYIPKKTRRALLNSNTKSSALLSVMTPFPDKGRVITF